MPGNLWALIKRAYDDGWPAEKLISESASVGYDKRKISKKVAEMKNFGHLPREWSWSETRAPAPAKTAGRSLEDFRAEYDKDFIVPKKIKEGLKLLGAGWEYEVAFARLAGISLNDLSNYRDAFSDHVVVIRRDGKRAWAGNAATAAAMKEMLA